MKKSIILSLIALMISVAAFAQPKPQGAHERKAPSVDKYKKMAQRRPNIFKKPWARWMMKREWGRKLMFALFGKKKDASDSAISAIRLRFNASAVNVPITEDSFLQLSLQALVPEGVTVDLKDLMGNEEK